MYSMANKRSFAAEMIEGDEPSNSHNVLPDQQPPWRKAFSLADNVRFTRTPDCEIIRKRAEIDPDYAARFGARAQKKQRTSPVEAKQEKETMPQAVAVASPDSYALPLSVSMPTVHEIAKTPSTLISDFAFFEAGLFDLSGILTPEASNLRAGEQRANEEAEGAIEVPAGSIIDLFRTLECRFSAPPAPVLASHQFKASGSFETHYKMEAEVSLTIKGLASSQPESISSAAEEENIDEIAREAIETESVAIEAFEEEVESETWEEEVKAETELKNESEETKGKAENAAAEENMTACALVTKTPVMITPRSESMLDPSVSLLRPAHLVEDYTYPSLDLLQMPVYKDGAIISQETLERSAGLLESVLEDFGIKGEIIHVRPGPVVTLYEFEPAPGVKSSRIIGLSDDIARSMSAISTRVAVIPGRNVIGIELPNSVRDTVFLRELVQSKSFCDSEFKLALALGKNIGGEPIIAELAKMPHLLVAGTTGSGKSVAINTMILSLLYRLKPDQCRLIMVDPKMLELSIYDGIPHLLTPVVTDPKKAVTALKWAVREMEERYRKMAKLGVRNIDGFNARVKQAASAGESITCTVQAGFDKETGELLYAQEAMDLTPLPYIVIIVDEMADLMMVAGKEIEGAIQRLAQMARAAGIHLIMATQRPSVDVITGTIKANFPTRISFQVTSRIDSRTILGEHGAETLLGQGDMLHMAGGGRVVRVHGAFVSDAEVEHIVAHLKSQGKPDYLATVTDGEEEGEEEASPDNIAEIVAASGEDSEELYIQAVKVVMRDKKCSTSYIQRRLGVGYNKAASLVERMEREGLVGQANHVGKREILSQ